MERLVANPVLAVHDQPASARWYHDVMGCETHDADPGNWVFCGPGSVEFMLGHCPDAPHASDIGDHSYVAYLDVDGIDAYCARVTAVGAEIVKDPMLGPWGMKEFGVRRRRGIGSRSPTHTGPIRRRRRRAKPRPERRLRADILRPSEWSGGDRRGRAVPIRSGGPTQLVAAFCASATRRCASRG